MANHRVREKKALKGNFSSVSGSWGRGKPKIGVEEFMSIAGRFGFSKKTLKKIRAAAESEDMGEGPFLVNYYTDLKESKVAQFERLAREFFGVKYAMAVTNGTGALHSAYVAAGVGPGKEVLCPAIGFMATASSAVLAGGVPIFCDVDETMGMDPKKVESLITPRTVAIAPTGVMGNVYDIETLLKIARKHKLRVIEDCAQSCGGTFKGKLLGTWGDIGCFSISAYKIIGGGEGGFLITNDKNLFERIQQTAECGGLWRPERFGPPRYEGELFCGTNYRMSELEAAIDVVQIKKLKATVRRFRSVRKRVLQRLKSYRGIVPQPSNDFEGEIGYILRFYPETFDLGRKIVKGLSERGVVCETDGPDARPNWHLASEMFPVVLKTRATDPSCSFHCPHYLEAGGQVEYGQGDCPVADDLFKRAVTVSLNQWYSAQECRDLAEIMNEVFSTHCEEDKNGASWLRGR
jgi:8-amino-3,8-dideoxy-alpha-D-manno-octulosonate transaminase